MGRESILIGMMILMSLLIVAKGDRQIIHLLEGKLYKKGFDIRKASPVYKKHKKILSVFLFVCGFSTIGISIILLVENSQYFTISAVASFSLIGLGVWGRLRSFGAANRELNDAGNAWRD